MKENNTDWDTLFFCNQKQVQLEKHVFHDAGNGGKAVYVTHYSKQDVDGVYANNSYPSRITRKEETYRDYIHNYEEETTFIKCPWEEFSTLLTVIEWLNILDARLDQETLRLRAVMERDRITRNESRV